MFKKKVFKNRNFMLLWLGQLVSYVGNHMYSFAMAWFIYELTGSTLAMSASILTSFLPRAILSPLAGVWADRYNRKAIIILCDVVSGLIVLGLFGISCTRDLNLITILVFNTMLSVVSTFFGPAISAATQSVLSEDQYQDANSLSQLRFRFASVVGALCGGLLLKTIGVEYLLLINGLSFCISAVSECFIQVPPSQKTGGTNSMSGNIGVALKFLFDNKILLIMSLFAAIIANGTFMSMNIYMPGIFKDVLHQSSPQLGVYYGIEGIFATVTSMYLLGAKKKFDPYKSVLVTLALEALVVIGVGLMPNLLTAYVIGAVLGIACAACSIMSSTVFQMLVPNDMMGRVSSFNALASNIAMPVFTILFGILGERFPLQNIVLVSGILFLVLLLPAPYMFASEGEGFFIKKTTVLSNEQHITEFDV